MRLPSQAFGSSTTATTGFGSTATANPFSGGGSTFGQNTGGTWNIQSGCLRSSLKNFCDPPRFNIPRPPRIRNVSPQWTRRLELCRQWSSAGSSKKSYTTCQSSNKLSIFACVIFSTGRPSSTDTSFSRLWKQHSWLELPLWCEAQPLCELDHRNKYWRWRKPIRCNPPDRKCFWKHGQLRERK